MVESSTMRASAGPPEAAQGRGLLRVYAYEQLRARIFDGTLALGAPISEAELAAGMGVSRTPVREALQALVHEGLVEVYPKRGSFVARLSEADARDSFELRDAIETAAARLAARRRTPEQLEAMAAALGAAVVEPSYYRASDFHRLVVEASRNRYLLDAFLAVAGRTELVSRVAARLEPGAVIAENHRPIYEAIAASDPDEAEEAMRRHLQHHLGRILEHLG